MQFDKYAIISDKPVYSCGSATGLIVTSTDPDAYPINGRSDTDGYWYGNRTIQSSATTYTKGSTSYGTVESTNPSAYPNDGRHSDGYYYKFKESFEDTCTITFYGGLANSIQGSQTITMNTATAITSAYQMAPSGWSFYGWAESGDTATRKYKTGDKVTLAKGKDLTLYAIYSRSLTFTQTGGTSSSLTQYYYGGSPGKVTTPAITVPKDSSGNAIGWTAYGWWSGTTAAKSRTAAGNTSYAFAWDAPTQYYSTFYRTLTVSYKANGGSGTTASTTQTQYYNSYNSTLSSSVKLAANAFTAPTGKEFVNWGTTTSGGTKYAASSTQTALIGNTIAAKNAIDLYAQWQSANRAPTITTQPSAASAAYGNTASVSVVATAPGTLSYQWQSSANNSTWTNVSGATGRSYVVPATTAAGTYYYRCVITSTMTGVAALSTTSSSAKVTVTQREVTLTWANTSFTYDGKSHIPTLTVGNLANGEMVTSTPTAAKTAAGSYTATAGALTGATAANYKLPGTKTQAFTIGKRALTFTWGTNSFTYDGNEHAPALTVGNVVSGETVTAPVTGGAVNAGNYTAQVTGITGATAANYSLPSNTSKAFTIGKRALTISWSGATSYTYDGQPHSPVATVGNIAPDAPVTYEVTPAQVNAGSYVAQVSNVSDVDNYSLPANTSLAFSIAKVTLALQWGSTTIFEYDGSVHGPALTLGNVVAGEAIAPTVSNPTAVNAGEYTALVTGVTGATADNYVLPVSRSKEYRIEKATSSFDTTGGGYPNAGSESRILHLSSDAVELASGFVTANPTGLRVRSTDDSKVTPVLNGGTLSVIPIGTTGTAAPVRVTLYVDETQNYSGYEYTFNLYVSGDPAVSVSYTPTTDTKTNVIAKLKVTDPYTAVDTSHYIESVAVGETLLVDTNEDTIYEYSFEENASDIPYVVRDSYGGETRGYLSVDWIDKLAPTVVLSTMSATDSGVLMYAQASDNHCRFTDLEYCWSYTDTAADVWQLGMSTRNYAPDTMVVVAVRDKAGNIGSAELKAEYKPISDMLEPFLIRAQKTLRSVSAGDISGYIFGENKYMTASGQILRYAEAPLDFIFEIEQVSEKTYVEGYLTIENQRVPVEWFKDSSCTETAGTVSSDGKAIALIQGKGFGKITLDPAIFVKRTVRNASAILHLIIYDDKDRAGRLTAEQYTMPYSVDLTPPSITTSYNGYSRELSIRVIDAMSGLETGNVNIQFSGEAPRAVLAVTTMTYPTSGTDAFSLTLSASDKLGNTATSTKSYTPLSGSDGGHGSGSAGIYTPSSDGADSLNTLFSRSRLFSKYLVNGSKSNADVSSIPNG